MDIEKVISELTLEEKAGLCSGADFWQTKSVDRLGIPKVFMTDGPHGLRKQKGDGDHLGINESISAVCFPTASALASSFDRSLLGRLGETLGDECRAENVAMLLGPGVNIKRSPLCGRNFEYFSEDPYLAGEMGAAYVKGLQSKGIAACVKHFAANNQETRRMSGSSEVDERTLHEIYLPAFENVVKEGKTRSVMCCYNKINGTYGAENRWLLTEVLREKWGFDGFVVTDWGAVKDRVKGLLAGLDLEMPGGPGSQDAAIVQAVKEGKLAESVLDEAVRNMLQFIADSQKVPKGGTLDIEKDHALAAEFAAECAVLLKNNNNILPLNKNAKVAFIGEFAAEPRYQGAGSSHINVPHAVGALEAAVGLNVVYAKGYVADSEETDDALLAEAVSAAKAADVAVIFAGLPDAFESEGFDRDNMDMPANQNTLISAIAAVQPNVVVVLHAGSSMEMPWESQVPAILHTHLGGDNVGTAQVALLFGDVNPSGKLAETYPIKLAHNPSFLNFPGEGDIVEYHEGVFVGYRYYDKKQMDVLFPFGYGLSYTTFAYSDITLDKSKMNDSETLTVTCKVKNTGSRKGKEVVQLYVHDIDSSVRRPIRELKGFEKVELAPGEETVVTFELSKRAFAYYETKIHDWFVESGTFAIEIGASSRDIRLSAEVEVQGTIELPVCFTRYSTISDLMRTAKGREFVNSMMQQSKGLLGADVLGDSSEQVLGKAGAKMMERMMADVPLSTLASFGMMTFEQLDGLIAMLNS